MERVDSFMPMEISTTAFGRTTKLMDSESTVIWMVPDMKAIGKKISSMDKVLRPGPMELVTMETMLKERNTVAESSLGLMVVPTQVSSMRTT